MRNAVITGFVRSPFTLAHKGALAKTRPDDILTPVVKALVERTGVNADDIEDLKLGCAFPEGEQGLNMARMIVLQADLPISVGGVTLNRFCGSSMQSIHDAAGAIAAGAGDVFICAGIESMTRVPMTGFNPAPNPALYERKPGAYDSMGDTAEAVAKEYGLSRKEQDEFAVRSQEKAADAIAAGKLKDEIVTVDGVEADGCPRPGTTVEALGGLNPAFDKDGTVTAGTSSPLTDGGVAVLVTSEEYADANNLPKIARIKSFAVAGCKPETMGLGPIPATKKALERAGLSVGDIDIIELNEAFASQSLACIRDLELDINKINLDGGAIALGHPLGATGARITGKAATLLQREGKKYALATQCIGGGQGIATILEAI